MVKKKRPGKGIRLQLTAYSVLAATLFVSSCTSADGSFQPSVLESGSTTTMQAPDPVVSTPTTVEVVPRPDLGVNQIRSGIWSEIPLVLQAWGQTQSAGVIANRGELEATGIEIDGELRFGTVSDPLAENGNVIEYRIDSGDPETVGGVRTETVHYSLPSNQEFWQATRMMFEDWSGSTDKQIVFQWHDGDNSGLGPPAPVLAFYVTGSKLGIKASYDSAPVPGPNTYQSVTLFEEAASPVAGVWHDLIIHAKVSPFVEDGGFIRIWRDGELIVDHVGPLAFNQPDVQDYAKLGIYHWLNAGNDWDPAYPSRSVYVDRMLIIDDEQASLTIGDVQALLDTP